MKRALFVTVSAVAYMSEIAETVLVKQAHGDVRINKSDYDANPNDYTLSSKTKQEGNVAPDAQSTSLPAEGIVIPPAPSAPHFAEPVAPSTVTADTIAVAKHGKKFYAVYASSGEKITDMIDIDKDGYADEGAAWAAVMAAKRQPHEQNVTPPNMPVQEGAQETPQTATSHPDEAK